MAKSGWCLDAKAYEDISKNAKELHKKCAYLLCTCGCHNQTEGEIK